MATTGWYPVRVRRLGIVMAPNPADPYAAGGVLNPAAARARRATSPCCRALSRSGITRASVQCASPCGGPAAAVRGRGHGAPPRSGLGPREARR